MDSATLDDLISGYALDDLSASEAREFDAVLVRDASVRREAEALRQALDTLALEAGVEAPPPDLRARVMAVAEPPARRWRLPGWPVLGFTAASTVGVAAVAAVIVLALRLGDLQQTVDDMQAGLSAQRAALVDIYATQPHTVTLHGMPGAEDAWAQLMFDDAGSQVMLVVDGLHAPRHDHVYHLWLVHESGARVSGANFSTDLAGSAVVLVQSEHPVYVFHAFEVTEELMHVSPSSPTGDPMLAGTMPQ